MKVKFDIKYRAQIESGEYRVETENGYPVTIYRWDFKDKENTPIMGSYIFEDGTEYCGGWTNEGRFDVRGEPGSFDLFIVTPDPELTEFEQSVRNCIVENLTTHGREMSSTVFIDDATAKKLASELFGLARNQLQIEGLVTMEHLNIACEAEYQSGLADGKNEALNDLPRWKKCDKNTIYNTKFNLVENEVGRFLMVEGYQIDIDSLEKLPGFKED